MNETLQALIIAFILVAFAPWVAGKRANRKRKKQIQKSGIVAICPYCKTENALEKIRNFICYNCNNAIAFYKNFQTEEPADNLVFIKCSKCNTENYAMLRYCLSCHNDIHSDPLEDK